MILIDIEKKRGCVLGGEKECLGGNGIRPIKAGHGIRPSDQRLLRCEVGNGKPTGNLLPPAPRLQSPAPGWAERWRRPERNPLEEERLTGPASPGGTP